MLINNKKTWGKSTMYFCPVSEKVWQEKYDYNTGEIKHIIHYDMPTYGLERKTMKERDNESKS